MLAGAVSGAENFFASFAVARPLRGEFTYLVPNSLKDRLQPGQRVRLPFGRSSVLGFYLAPAPQPPPEVVPKLRAMGEVLESTAALTPDVVELLRFAAKHYRYPLGEALKAALPPGMTRAEEVAEAAPDTVEYAVALPEADSEALKRAPAQQAALSYLLAVGGRAAVEEVGHAIPGARVTLKKLEQRGWVRFEREKVVVGVREGLAQHRPAKLTEEQAAAVKVLTQAVDAGGFAPFLLQGVTGSGKTEVYLRLVEHALGAGKGALVLVPEIALTPQLVGRFRSRFGPQVALLHSALKDKERLRYWQQLRREEVRIAVGVRSAVFAPVPNLGVVVVDEEHDPSFKQEEKLRYQARDLAVVRAKQANAMVLLGSATPSLETIENVRRGRYQTLRLTKRVDDRPMPELALVDLRVERPRTPESRSVEPPVLSPTALSAMVEVLRRGQQVILFLNRRGHSTYLLCEVCGESLKCPHCDVCLTEHLSSRRLMCHYCNFAQPEPGGCPACSGPLLKLGVGTQRVEAEVLAAFPTARVARLDRDAAGSAERLTELLAAFARREIDVLVGTQMVAKGHDFPGVTLVCVTLADTSLSLPDFRASERTFHLLTQVAGRAGRGAEAGRVLVQSYNAEAEPIARMLAQDFEGFAEAEAARRKALAWPPFSRLAVVRIEGESADLTQRWAKAIADQMAKALPPSREGVRLLGPAPAPIARIKGKTRWQIAVKGPTHQVLDGPLSAAEAMLEELPNSIRCVIDVDPAAMM
ncbi:MAG: primosomal protein N' [Myxococcaceae bacterium]|nr:primosomal protein N' [Myxococcaceae bacterium]